MTPLFTDQKSITFGKVYKMSCESEETRTESDESKGASPTTNHEKQGISSDSVSLNLRVSQKYGFQKFSENQPESA